MGQLGQFIINHWALCLALVIVLAIIFINERLDLRKRAKQLSPQGVVSLINNDGATVIDLREMEIWRSGHIIDAIRASVEDFEQGRMDKYKNLPVVLVCARGQQSAALAIKLRTMGFSNPIVMAGGMNAWQADGLPLIKGK